MAISLVRLLFVFLSVVALVSGLDPAGWRAQSIYQVMTDRFARTDASTTAPCDFNEYCGGTYRGLINRIDYIQEMGFTAIWISPIVKNVVGSTGDGNSYFCANNSIWKYQLTIHNSHGYWAQDIYALNPAFGPEADLKDLVNILHSRGIYLMVDVVPNHMASISSRDTVDYSALRPFNSQLYYHAPCGIDYNNQTSIEKCWIGSNTVSLPDLRTEDTNVRNMWNTWIGQLVSNYSIDGLRIDTTYQIDTGFWAGFQAAANGIHTLGEVWQGDIDIMCPYQNYLHGLMNYGTFYWITQAFQSTSGSIQNLVDGLEAIKNTCNDVTLLGSFIENHDNPRFPSLTSDMSLIRNAITFTILQDGIPIIYQGQEAAFSGAGVPSNREPIWTTAYNKQAPLYLHIRTVNKIRSWAAKQDASYLTYNAWPIQHSTNRIVMRKGKVVSVYTNSGSGSGSQIITIGSANSGFTAGQRITEILRCTALLADSTGNLGLTIPAGGLPSILYPTAGLSGSGICGL